MNDGDYCFLFEPGLDEFYDRLIRKRTLRLLLSVNSNYKKGNAQTSGGEYLLHSAGFAGFLVLTVVRL